MQFTSARSQCQKQLRRCHFDYTESLFANENAGSKFWAYIKTKRKDNCSVAPLRENGMLISDAKGKANALNRQYCSVFNTDNRGSEPTKGPSSIPDMPPISVSEEGVRKLLKALEPNKASGPDQISPTVLKELADVLCKPLAQIFQAAIDSGEAPNQWKTATVTPIFKKGDKHKASNYRPVSLTSVCCKICEHIISKAIRNHFEKHEVLCDHQHGFRYGRSCETQLLMFVDDLASSMAEGKQIDAIVLDFSKAFDVVPHGSLLTKLSYYGVRGTTLKWIDSFLSGRTQRVLVDGEYSDTAPVTSGVPQGSVLGPMLFLAYINDMPECITSQTRLFADDTIVYRHINTQRDCDKLQEDMHALEEWEEKWGMTFNPSKCETIRITRKKTPITRTYILKEEELKTVRSAKYLGVTVASDLSWNEHVANTVAKANRALGFVKRNVVTPSTATKERAYNALVRPILEYASTVWSPGQKCLCATIEAVQRRAARYVCGLQSRQESVTAMMHRLQWETLENRRKKGRVTMLYKIWTDQVAIPSTKLVPTTRVTRGHSAKLQQLVAKKNYVQQSFFPSAIKLWNSLPDVVVSQPSIEDFKEKLKTVKFPQNT